MRKGMGMALGIPIGAGVGTALGVSMGNVGVWVAIGVAIGIAIGVTLEAQFKKEATKEGSNTPINPAQVEEKKQNIERVLAAAKTQGRITNDEVQALLNVSDATAERYLAELEREGRLIQQGNGRAIYYVPR